MTKDIATVLGVIFILVGLLGSDEKLLGPNEKGVTMTKNIATVLGVIFILVGLLGFAVPDMMGMHLSLTHKLIHIVSGVLALYFGLRTTPWATRNFCVVFGAIYALLGLAGFVLGGTSQVLTIIPNQLVLGTMDHIVHVILGAVFLFAGLYKKPVAVGPPMT